MWVRGRPYQGWVYRYSDVEFGCGNRMLNNPSEDPGERNCLDPSTIALCRRISQAPKRLPLARAAAIVMINLDRVLRDCSIGGSSITVFLVHPLQGRYHPDGYHGIHFGVHFISRRQKYTNLRPVLRVQKLLKVNKCIRSVENGRLLGAVQQESLYANPASCASVCEGPEYDGVATMEVVCSQR